MNMKNDSEQRQMVYYIIFYFMKTQATDQDNNIVILSWQNIYCTLWIITNTFLMNRRRVNNYVGKRPS